MPVSFLPLIVAIGLVAIPIALAAYSRRAGLVGAGASVLAVGAIVAMVYVPGMRLHARAASGDPRAQYQYAQWLENHAETIQQVLPVPIEPDV